MFWDSVLDPLRSLLSYNPTSWTIASLVAAALSSLIITGTKDDARQFVFVAAVIFVPLCLAFYLP
jgi:ABC-type proline/glycine betaine transport system permease subunit